MKTVILAGWFSVGLGDAVEAISDATWKVVLVRAIERMAPTLLLGLVLVCVIAAALAATYLTGKFVETGREAMRDDRVTRAEWVLIGLQATIIVPTVIGLILFAGFLAYAGRAGLLELMS